MAFNIRFARLFEIRILHGFYLDMGNEKNFFELDEDIPQELQFKEGVLKRYNLLISDLEIEPTQECQNILDQNRMIFKTLPTGFMVGLRVQEEILEDGTLGLTPFTSVSPDLKFEFKIKAKKQYWSNFSSLRLRPNINSSLYFNNYEDIDEISAPSLSRTVPERSIRFHEMGELVSDTDTNQIYEAISGVPTNIPFASTAHWKPVPDFRYINYSDQSLIGLRFNYYFSLNSGQSISTASFVLSNLNGQEIATINPAGNGPFTNHFLDFRPYEIQPGKYQLSITGNNGYADKKTIYIDDRLFDNKSLAVVSIKHKDDLPQELKLFEEDGSLRRIGNETIHPVFELRFKPRITYWRYIFHPNQDAAIIPPADSDVEPDSANVDRLVSINPFPITNAGSKVKLNSGKLLPNPLNLDVMMNKVDPDQKHYSDIFLDII